MINNKKQDIMRTYTKQEQDILMATLGDWENSETLTNWMDEWENEILLSDLPEGQYTRNFTFEVLLQYLNDMFDDVDSLITETLEENELADIATLFEHPQDGSGDYLCDCCNSPVNTEDWCFTCKDYVYIHHIND